MDRRAFLISSAKALSASALGWSLFSGCRSKKNIPFSGAIMGPSYDVGHRLLQGGIPPIRREERVPVVIVGAGISGLSAGWKLSRSGFHDFAILELEPEAGGVSRSGRNSISPFPWGGALYPSPHGGVTGGP